MFHKIKNNLMPLGLIIAVLGLVGSLYFSEVLGLIPCTLCWYQRIALYPLVAIFAVGLAKRLESTWSYAMPLIIFGWLTALYNVLLVYGFVEENNFTCSAGVSCATVTWSMLGFINIPFLSFLAFTVLLAMTWLSRKK